MMPQEKFHRQFPCDEIRECSPTKTAFPHQKTSLNSLQKWYQGKEKRKGVILSLPTGSGKTFVAVRFLCKQILPKGYRVLWMAHTHHLLEQAYYTFAPKDEKEQREKGMEIANAALAPDREKRKNINIRVISGESNHHKLEAIEKDDDVLICTIQTIINGRKRKHAKLKGFLNHKKIFVVFDEAHHSPADTYHELLMRFQKAGFPLLGLTATPSYSDEKKIGRLSEIYPQKIIPNDSITKIQNLQKQGILSNVHVLKPINTGYKPNFDINAFWKWKKTKQHDIPAEIIDTMADDQERNEIIANAYVRGQKEFGKTIIYADRRTQCETICVALTKRDVQAAAVYSHAEIDRSGADIRNKRQQSKSTNAETLRKFKDKKNALQVIVNVNILTEGTDVPSVQTVFITRQTKSEIRLRQMIGRALRGPKMGGLPKANIVMFEDNWSVGDILAEFAALPQDVLDTDTKTSKRYKNKNPMQWVSIKLIQMIARQMDSGSTDSHLKFTEYFPIGWYKVSAYSFHEEEQAYDVPFVENTILVYEHEDSFYKALIKHIRTQKQKNHKIFKKWNQSGPTAVLEGLIVSEAEKVTDEYFGKYLLSAEDALHIDKEEKMERYLQDTISLYKHFLQNDKPIFFDIKDREKYNIEILAKRFSKKEISPFKQDQLLVKEFEGKEGLWQTIYPDYENFKNHFNQSMGFMIAKKRKRNEPLGNRSFGIKETGPKLREASEKVKEQIRKRDKQCLCCGSKRLPDVDHITPSYLNINHKPNNLQLLCISCHSIKSKRQIKNPYEKFNFLEKPPKQKTYNLELSIFNLPNEDTAERWQQFVRRVINYSYGCRAVKKVNIKKSGILKSDIFEVELYSSIKKNHFNAFSNKLKDCINSGKKNKIKKIELAKAS